MTYVCFFLCSNSKKENAGMVDWSSLDLNISSAKKIFLLKYIYDNSNAFTFCIVRMLCFCTSIAKIFYAPLGAGNSKLPEPLILLDYETAK